MDEKVLEQMGLTLFDRYHQWKNGDIGVMEFHGLRKIG
nr:MAG TPA: hypothetical protein [Caudoviricetes sp.]